MILHCDFAASSGGSGSSPRIMAFSAIMSTQALICAETRSGMRGIDHAQVLGAAHVQLRIRDRFRPDAHGLA